MNHIAHLKSVPLFTHASLVNSSPVILVFKHLFLLQSYRKQDTALDYQMVGLFPNVFLRFVASGAFRQPLVVAIITAGR